MPMPKRATDTEELHPENRHTGSRATSYYAMPIGAARRPGRERSERPGSFLRPSLSGNTRSAARPAGPRHKLPFHYQRTGNLRRGESKEDCRECAKRFFLRAASFFWRHGELCKRHFHVWIVRV